jgi:hypothetical protein
MNSLILVFLGTEPAAAVPAAVAAVLLYEIYSGPKSLRLHNFNLSAVNLEGLIKFSKNAHTSI